MVVGVAPVGTVKEHRLGFLVDGYGPPVESATRPLVVLFHGGYALIGHARDWIPIGYQIARATGFQVLVMRYPFSPETKGKERGALVAEQLLSLSPRPLALIGVSGGGYPVIESMLQLRNAPHIKAAALLGKISSSPCIFTLTVNDRRNGGGIVSSFALCYRRRAGRRSVAQVRPASSVRRRPNSVGSIV